ncbi:uncharacterized protein TNCV_1822541 [Trichonephila clavipes]|nr:uncharacterized protein TNCV_1822541 [Trichonephila clavipes]
MAEFSSSSFIPSDVGRVDGGERMPPTIVRVHYFVRGGFVGHLSRASSKHLSSHLPVDELDSSRGQKGVALQVQDARVGVGFTKKPTPLDVDVRRSDVTALALSYRTFPLRKKALV